MVNSSCELRLRRRQQRHDASIYQTSAKHHPPSVRVEHTAASVSKGSTVDTPLCNPYLRIVNKNTNKSFTRPGSTMANEKCMIWHFQVSAHVYIRSSVKQRIRASSLICHLDGVFALLELPALDGLSLSDMEPHLVRKSTYVSRRRRFRHLREQTPAEQQCSEEKTRILRRISHLALKLNRSRRQPHIRHQNTCHLVKTLNIILRSGTLLPQALGQTTRP
ncbi:hypothetical protein KCU89_g51, partial [Aureobasidium melanogenum]